MPELDLDVEALADYKPRAATTKGLRPVNYRVDSDGTLIAVSLPGPEALAAMLSLPGVDAYRDGVGLVMRPKGSDTVPTAVSVLALRESLHESLQALAERPDSSQAYRDLRLAARSASPRLAAYVVDVVRSYVRTLPKVPRAAKEAEGQRRPAKSAEERLRDHRARVWREETATAEWIVDLYTSTADEDHEPPEVGARVPGADLADFAERWLHGDPDDPDDVGTIGEYEECAEKDELDQWDDDRGSYPIPPPSRPRHVSRQRLYQVAEQRGHTITRPGNAVVITVCIPRRRSRWRAHPLGAHLEAALTHIGRTVLNNAE